MAPKAWRAPNSATAAEERINFLIDHQCPQCGAPAELAETDRLFHCDFCKVSSYIMQHGYFRYMLPHRAPEEQELVYFPYWRFKGMIFSCLASGIQNRFLDVSRQAVDSAFFPTSVGLRSQSLKLRFVSPESKGWFIKPVQRFKQAMETMLARFNLNLPQPLLHQSHIGESVSLIYAPFYVGKRVMDAVLNQPVSAELDEGVDLTRYKGGPADWHIRFIATLCPHCGWDMQGRRDALVLHCTNCHSMWQATKQGLARINVAHMPSGENEKTLYLPFWRISADVSGIALETYADLVRAANLPRVVQSGWEHRPCHFWSPAFKVQPRSFLRLIQQLTLSQPNDDLTGRVPKGRMHPVNLPISESVETLKLNLAGVLRPRRVVETRLVDIQVRPKRYLLVYLPFTIHHHDLVQTIFKIAINRNQLALAGNL